MNALLTRAEELLALGHPREAAELLRGDLQDARARLTLAAALLRLGEGEEARTLLIPLPPSARRAVLLARAHWLRGERDVQPAQDARQLARAEGDGPALSAAVTLLAELQLAAGEGRAALLSLAEGLKVWELMNLPTDAHLLAVLARVQCVVGSPAKAARTAQKALDRSAPGSPARVVALSVLGRTAEAQAELSRGELAPSYLPDISTRSRPSSTAPRTS